MVLEVSSFVAAPLGGLTLAQLGADVIRIDPVGGGPDLGRWPLAPSGTSLYWTGLNKGKRSVTLNFRDAEGRRLLGDLLAASGPGGGIVLTNAGQDWLGYAELARVRPDLIHLQIQGHRDGRDRRRLHGQRRDGIPADHRSRGPGGPGEPRPARLGRGLRALRRGRAARRGAAPAAHRGGQRDHAGAGRRGAGRGRAPGLPGRGPGHRDRAPADRQPPVRGPGPGLPDGRRRAGHGGGTDRAGTSPTSAPRPGWPGRSPSWSGCSGRTSAQDGDRYRHREVHHRAPGAVVRRPHAGRGRAGPGGHVGAVVAVPALHRPGRGRHAGREPAAGRDRPARRRAAAGARLAAGHGRGHRAPPGAGARRGHRRGADRAARPVRGGGPGAGRTRDRRRARTRSPAHGRRRSTEGRKDRCLA